MHALELFLVVAAFWVSKVIGRVSGPFEDKSYNVTVHDGFNNQTIQHGSDNPANPANHSDFDAKLNLTSPEYKINPTDTEHAVSYFYWIDTNSCSGSRDITVDLADMFALACAGSDSLRVAGVDRDFRYVFRRIFKVPTDDTTQLFPKSPGFNLRHGAPGADTRQNAKATVEDVLTSVCYHWGRTYDRPIAHLRLFCDNGAHFSMGVAEPQHGRDGLDPSDGIFGSLTDCSGTTQAGVDLGRGKGEQWDNQNRDRGALTLCDRAWTAMKKGPLSKNPPDWDYTGFTDEHGVWHREKLDSLTELSFTMLHEWTHSFPYFSLDIPNRNRLGQDIRGSAYMWRGVVNKPPNDAVLNAESYAFTGVLGWLARQQRANPQRGGSKSGGFTLPRVPNTRDPVALEIHENSIQQGFLAFYHDITTPGNPGGPAPLPMPNPPPA